MTDVSDDPASKLRRGRGRPTRAEASAKALAGVDVSAVDPLDVLRAVAADNSAPASARVAAARAILEEELNRELRRRNWRAIEESPGGP
jgi:hypothetical protein